MALVQADRIIQDPLDIFWGMGVWAWWRHSNFFIEVIVLLGLYISSLNILKVAENAAVASPIFIMLLLMLVSGIPILKKSADERYGNKPG